MIKEITKDITTITEGIACHQVNCRGTMGSGVALAIRQKWPEVFKTYHEKYLENLESPWKQLGEMQLVKCDDNVQVANLFGQYDFGANGRYTEYSALSSAMKTLDGFLQNVKNYTECFHGEYKIPDIYIPYKMGCDRGGGDWNIVSQMIEEILDTDDRTIYICSLP